MLIAQLPGAPDININVDVDWMAQLREGGVTMIALAVLSVAMLAFIIERLIALRAKNFAPRGLQEAVRPLFAQGRYDEVLKRLDQQPSILSTVLRHVVTHRTQPPDMLIATAGDVGSRELGDHFSRCSPLAVIASLAPLLGLLGTMIGMIEAFQLVSIFGDEGGASMLASSIAKALITTAVGLIIAIPAIVAYHFFKHRTGSLAKTVESQLDDLLNTWVTDRSTRRSSQAEPRRSPVAVDQAVTSEA